MLPVSVDFGTFTEVLHLCGKRWCLTDVNAFNTPVQLQVQRSRSELTVDSLIAGNMMKDYSLNRMIVLFTTVGFAFLGVDSVLEHWDVLSSEWMSYVPIVFGALGLVLGGITVSRWVERWIRVFQIYLLAAFIVAGTGFYLHVAESDEDELAPEKVELEKEEKAKPLLAPLSFAGLAAFGLLGTSRSRKADAADK